MYGEVLIIYKSLTWILDTCTGVVVGEVPHGPRLLTILHHIRVLHTTLFLDWQQVVGSGLILANMF